MNDDAQSNQQLVNISIDATDRKSVLEAQANRPHELDQPQLSNAIPEMYAMTLEANFSAMAGAFGENFYDLDKAHNKQSLSEIGLIAMYSKIKSSFYDDLHTQKYDSFEELKLSGGPDVDNEQCLIQLQSLIDRANRQVKQGFESKDINLYQLLDTYGRIPSGLLLGHLIWPGQYHECLRLKIETPTGKLATRYCYAFLRHKSWPTDSRYDDIAFKAGICLPRACDSLKHKNKYEMIKSLFELQARDMEKDESRLVGVYCLPDEASAIRSLLYSPKSLLTALAFAGWILAVVYCTYKYERLKRINTSQAQEACISGSSKWGLSTGFSVANKCEANSMAEQIRPDPYFSVYEMLALTRNFKLLFSTGKASSLMEMGNKMSGKEPAKDVDGQHPTVDLSVVEGIKVVSTCYVIMGHVLMCISPTVVNGRDLAELKSPAFVASNLLPAFAVNSFFAITGLLTSYLLFKQNQSHTFITSPAKWISFIAYRYLRIMPMYAIVVLYTKHLARFTGSGPFWDYGTTAMGQRRTCEQESWLWTLLFGANFKAPLDHCIPSAWYLANDFQFFIITPIFLALLHKNPTLGKRLLKACIIIGFITGVYGIFNVGDVDLRSIVQLQPHGFKTYVTNLSYSYTKPHHRIPAYLCGLLLGYYLHCFEQQARDFKNNVRNVAKPEWPQSIIRYGPTFSASCLVLLAVSPSIGSRIPFNQFWAKITIALVMPSYHILFALTIGVYTLLATTGYGNKFVNRLLSASFWKPLSRLSLCVVLINIEVITYNITSSSHMQYIGNRYLTAMNVMNVLCIYLVSIIVCLLFESPVRGGLNKLLAHITDSLAVKKKV